MTARRCGSCPAQRGNPRRDGGVTSSGRVKRTVTSISSQAAVQLDRRFVPAIDEHHALSERNAGRRSDRFRRHRHECRGFRPRRMPLVPTSLTSSRMFDETSSAAKPRSCATSTESRSCCVQAIVMSSPPFNALRTAVEFGAAS